MRSCHHWESPLWSINFLWKSYVVAESGLEHSKFVLNICCPSNILSQPIKIRFISRPVFPKTNAVLPYRLVHLPTKRQWQSRQFQEECPPEGEQWWTWVSTRYGQEKLHNIEYEPNRLWRRAWVPSLSENIVVISIPGWRRDQQWWGGWGGGSSCFDSSGGAALSTGGARSTSWLPTQPPAGGFLTKTEGGKKKEINLQSLEDTLVGSKKFI